MTTQLHQSLIVGGCSRQVYSDLPKILGKRLYKNLHPAFLLHLQEQQEDPIMMVSFVSFQHCACTSRHLNLRHLEASLYRLMGEGLLCTGHIFEANQLSFKQQLVTTWVQALTFNRETDRQFFAARGSGRVPAGCESSSFALAFSVPDLDGPVASIPKYYTKVSSNLIIQKTLTQMLEIWKLLKSTKLKQD